MQVGNLFNQLCLVDHVRKFRYHDLGLAVWKGFNIGHSADPDLSPARAVCFLRPPGSQDHAAGGKIRRLDDLHHFFNIGIPIFQNPVIYDLYHSVHHFPQVVGRDVGGHSYGDARSTVNQQVGIAGGQDNRFFFRFIEVWLEVHRIFIDIRQHLHGNFGEAGFRITHGRRAVPVFGTEVSVAVHQRITGIPFLCHIHQGAVNGTVSVRMIFTHRIAHDTGAFSMRLIRPVIQLDHGIKHAPLHGL